MKQVTLQIEDENYATFLAFLQTLDYVEVEDENALSELKVSLQEVRQMQESKLPKQTAEEFLDEL